MRQNEEDLNGVCKECGAYTMPGKDICDQCKSDEETIEEKDSGDDNLIPE